MHEDLNQELLAWIRGHFFGKYRGTVLDNSDSTNRGRLKVSVPSVLGDVDVWAVPCVPYAGDGVGFYSLPEPGTGVWVEFEAGDPSFAIWTGCFWGDGQLPDPGGASIKIWKTKSLTIRIDDDGDELKMSTTSGSTVTLSSDVKTESGGAQHSVGSSGIVSDSGGTGKAEVTQSGVSLDNGALQVM